MPTQNFGTLFDGARFSVLQACRGVAALLVVAYHVNEAIFNNPKYWAVSPFGHFFWFGNAGVDFFFVLRGFIIFAAHGRDIGQPSHCVAFLWKRFRRIYPVYWVVLVALIAVYFAIPTMGDGEERRADVILNSTLLFHVYGSYNSVLVPAWTLYHEVMFYALFAVLIINRRVGAGLMAVWFIVCVPTLFYDPEARAELFFKPIHLLFGMGMAVAWIVATRRIKAPLLVCAVGLGTFAAAAAEGVRGMHSPDGTLAMVYGIGSAVFIAGAIELERLGRVHIPASLVFLGDASYSVYLLNLVALSVLTKLAFKVVGTSHPGLAIPLSVGLAIAATGAGVVFYLAVERPLLRWLGRRSNRVAARTGTQLAETV